MCGINGFSFKDEYLIKSMNSAIAHRGPDGLSFHLDDFVSLGHARLSIIDLSIAATQPMFYSHMGRNACIVFNGEIYNYVELKSKLTIAGYSFSTASDTEVIIAAYIEWGEDLVYEMNGMWSFCIYDLDKKLFFCSRDRLGVKPLYYFCHDGNFIFSSELKGLLKHKSPKINTIKNINKDAVELYFSLGYIPAPYTIYNNVHKLESGSNIIFDLKNKKILKKNKYYKPPITRPTQNKKQLIEEGKELISDAVKLRMRSDVNVGAFLSGGVDSTTIVGEMKNFTDLRKLHTFSIGFNDKKYDETHYINIAKNSFQSVHHHHVYTERNFIDTLNIYSNVFDEPFGDYSSFPSYTVCKMARKDVTVVLSGDGGDEIFGGYPIYNTGFLIEKIGKLPNSTLRLLKNATSNFKSNDLAKKINETFKLSLLSKKDFYSEMFTTSRFKPEIFKVWSSQKMHQALELSDNNLSEALRIYDLLSNTLPDNFLVKVDRTSMANSIEVRSPFLDYRLVEFSQRIPNNLKVGFIGNKILMKEIVKDIIPKEIVGRNKMGFTPPIHDWLYNTIGFKDFMKYHAYLENISPELHNFYTRLFSYNSKGYYSDFYKIKLVIFGKWFEQWILEIDSAN